MVSYLMSRVKIFCIIIFWLGKWIKNYFYNFSTHVKLRILKSMKFNHKIVLNYGWYEAVTDGHETKNSPSYYRTLKRKKRELFRWPRLINIKACVWILTRMVKQAEFGPYFAWLGFIKHGNLSEEKIASGSEYRIRFYPWWFQNDSNLIDIFSLKFFIKLQSNRFTENVWKIFVNNWYFI